LSEFVEHNRRAWNEVHRRRRLALHAIGLPGDVLESLEPLAGARVLHLQCATGETTAQLIARGADVVGVDVADEAISIASELLPQAQFVRADVQDLPEALQQRSFDLVVTEGGVLTWLHDLDHWARGIVRALRPDGRFVLVEEHPVSACVDDLRWAEDYFDESVYADVGWEHFDLPGPPATELKHERFWRLGQVVTALGQAGLRIELLDERPGSWRGTDPRIPGTFVLVARSGGV
jgi:SAM-dependent methyltransferase